MMVRAFDSGKRWFSQHYLRWLLSPGRGDFVSSSSPAYHRGFPGSVWLSPLLSPVPSILDLILRSFLLPAFRSFHLQSNLYHQRWLFVHAWKSEFSWIDWRRWLPLKWWSGYVKTFWEDYSVSLSLICLAGVHGFVSLLPALRRNFSGGGVGPSWRVYPESCVDRTRGGRLFFTFLDGFSLLGWLPIEFCNLALFRP